MNVNNDKKTLVEILENYALGKNTLKWIPEGGEILKSINTEVVKIDFKRDDKDKPWVTSIDRVFINSIDDFEPMTGTYQSSYKKLNEEGEPKSIRIIPEGFSFNNPDKDNWMTRFVPLSLHFKLTEEELYYQRLKSLFNTRPGFTIDKIREYSKSKQEETLGYHNYIAAVIDTDVEDGLNIGIISFRIYGIRSILRLSKAWSFGIVDKDSHYFSIKLGDNSDMMENFSVNGTKIGNLKIFNIEN